MPDGIRSGLHYELSSTELASWLEGLADLWWNVDGDPLLTGLLSFPSTADELAGILRRLNRPLLVQDRRAEPKGTGELIDGCNLDELATSLGDNIFVTNGAKPSWAGDRLFFFSWKDTTREWLLVEDGATTESNRSEAAAVGNK